MNKRQKEELVRLAGKQVQFDCLMAPYTTFRVGGKVDALYEANDTGNLRRIISYAGKEHIPYLIVGQGSNLLVKDNGIEGMVILLRGSFATIEQDKTSDLTILAGGGVTIPGLLRYCRESGFGGVEFLAGIPGTIGGAVAMNAGAFGKEIGAFVLNIHIITQGGDVVLKDSAQLNFSYRQLEVERGSVIIRVCLALDPESKGIVAERIAGWLKKRKERQPLAYPSAGSVFRNPQNDFAGRLVEKVGLKGKRIGGAMISDKHANFIVNTGDARAEDILALICLVREKVRNETGVELVLEIQVVGR